MRWRVHRQNHHGHRNGQRGRGFWLLVAALASLSIGCKGLPAGQVSGTQTNSVPLSFAITAAAATPPAGVSLLSFEATLSGAQLEPGNVQILGAPLAMELTRLQTENSLVASTKIPPGTYTGVALTFANPTVTFENNGASSIVIGGVTCAPNQVCTAQPSPVSLTGTVNFSGGGITLMANAPAAVLLNLNLATALSGTLQPNFAAGAAVSELTSSASAPFTSFEDVAGSVTSKNSTNNSLLLQSALGNYTVAVNASTIFSNFPAPLCATPTFACIAANQIVSLDMNLQPDGSLLATRVFFEDSGTSQPEIEGIVVATAGLTPPAQFSMVVMEETPSVPGIPIGTLIGVELSSSPVAVFDVDNLGASASTASFSFQGIQDLLAGQEVQVQQLTGSTNVLINAGRVRLRSSRVTANVSLVAAPEITLGPLPPFLGTAGIPQLRVITLGAPAVNAFTEFDGSVTNISQIAVGNSVSVRAQLFKNGPLAGGVQPAVSVATKVIKH